MKLRVLVMAPIAGLVGYAGLAQDAAQPRPPARITIAGAPPVTPPPEAFFTRFNQGDREVARQFYKKHLDVKGLSVASAAVVDDVALQRTWDIVTHMLAGRPDILQVMSQNGTRLIIIGKDQVYTDMPEYRNHPNPTYQNERVRGTGGLGVTSFGEENLLNLAIDRYDDESIGVHEFLHTIDAALRRIDPTWSDRLRQAYQNAINQGLWRYAYAAGNQGEYWGEIAQSYFDSNRVNNWNHNHIGTREQLKAYDPVGYELAHSTFKLTPANDWRYKPLRTQPSVMSPPANFKIDPYYTKFTWAREFTVVGSNNVSDAALLKANDTIRKMFAYRHDILKAMIADGVKLVVLGRNETLNDLSESRDNALARKLLVVTEQSVLAPSGPSEQIALFATAAYRVTGLRPVDPNFDRQQKQQYELRVQRMDERFDQKLQKALDAARPKNLWGGLSDKGQYWARGVQAYFDAGAAPATTREQLKAYDPDLSALVEETMAYTDHQDWRFKHYAGAR